MRVWGSAWKSASLDLVLVRGGPQTLGANPDLSTARTTERGGYLQSTKGGLVTVSCNRAAATHSHDCANLQERMAGLEDPGGDVQK